MVPNTQTTNAARSIDPSEPAETVNTLSEKEIARARKARVSYLKRDNWSVYAKRLIGLHAGMPGASV